MDIEYYKDIEYFVTIHSKTHVEFSELAVLDEKVGNSYLVNL